jgi:hypothetical protein
MHAAISTARSAQHLATVESYGTLRANAKTVRALAQKLASAARRAEIATCQHDFKIVRRYSVGTAVGVKCRVCSLRADRAATDFPDQVPA